jgi:uncharacterized protein (DUF2062 family)
LTTREGVSVQIPIAAVEILLCERTRHVMPVILAGAAIGGTASFFWFLGWGALAALLGASLGASVFAGLAGLLLALKRSRRCKSI